MSTDTNGHWRYKFTVFTPTYNRARTLPRTYESLKAQTFRNFEWLIVDDGSTDGTEEVVRPWRADSAFPIRYVYQENAGKHIASNLAADLALGELIGTLDADDWYAPDALERFLHHWESIPAERRDRFVGVVGLCADQFGNVLGVPFPRPVMDSDYFEMQFKHSFAGDKTGVARTEITREFKFPELERGGLVPEALVYNRMARFYKARLFNEVLMYVEYQADGLSSFAGVARANSPRSTQLYYRELIEMRSAVPRLLVFRHHVNHTRFAFHAGAGVLGSRAGAASLSWWLATAPAGLALYLRDRLLLRRLANVRSQQ